jgi:beta-fructofuranosidase
MSCNSGSAIVHEGKIWLFYTAVSEDYNETVCAAYSEDGKVFVKCPENPVVTVPLEGNVKFRDPFVMKYGKGFRMLTGAGQYGVGRVLQFESEDLVNWNYKGELVSDGKFGSVIESPHLAEIDGKWVFIIQSEKHVPTKVLFATGDYDGDKFVFDDADDPFKSVDSGDDFFNPVTAEDENGAVVLMAWMFSMKMNSSAISCPREITVSRKGEVCLIPYGELRRRQVKESSFVSYASGRLRVMFEGRTLFDKAYKECPDLGVLEDVGTVEVFLEGGLETITLFVC